ncbi:MULTISPECIES: branched-chain amino acid aminotransferase [Bradyrhizobium]|jgi:branched-chain amino acid aminotransferase|uniref:branched-chain amino acid aminotransferase n=1 Tax=Bradyrhizobium TaxID=374 RepID=UPI00041633F9|nr:MULTISPECIES: branched-chain amino acid aminotransferase [Bradyrhizobium]KIU49159.1 branched-chain amino acid aminotransferase [Bradyrhizobium elkanii]MBK5652335.1 branched-chain amino acid aminotransferase [Rhizobium sp.]OCX28398.1 branched chain amino acid aminotransferase [Bradyrhizobium sp. UASWS1016]
MTLKFDIQPSPNVTSDKDRAAKLVDPGFGRVFTDHMAIVRYSQGKGWHSARVEARANFPLDPAGAVLHYAQEIFEGLKAYKRDDGGVNLFRPDANARRFHDSAERMAMAPLPEDVFIEAVEQLVRIDRAWIPGGEGSLYLRPFMIASEIFLGVKPSAEYIFSVIASPVGSYFKGGPAPVSIWVSENYTRAAIGGTGAVKCGGNYAASLRAQAEAIDRGCDQVVFLDAVERRYIEELGGMNIFFAFDDGSISTPPLGTILPGITRDSIIALAKDSGTRVREEPYTIQQWRADAASGKLKEAFACGTAAVISPIGKVCSASGDFQISGGVAGPVAMGLRKKLVDIQYGRTNDPHNWIRSVA